MKRSVKIFEAISIGIMVLFSTIFLYVAFTTENKMVVEGMKSMDFPKIIIIVQLLLVVLLVAKDFMGKQAVSEKDNAPIVENKVTLSVAAIIAYVLLWNVIGFCLSSFIFFTFEARMLDNERKLWQTILLSIAVVTVIFCVFGIGFKVNFPEPLPGLLRL